MIWIRRLLTMPFGVVLLVLLLLAVVLLQVNDTFLSPDFYRNRLREANIYEFALNDLVTSALDEARQLPADRFDSGLDENPLVTSGLTTEDVVGSLNRALPPEWVQELVEQILDEPAKYATGDHDDFIITLSVGDRVVQVIEEAKGLMRKADAYNLLFEQVELEIERALKTELPFGIDVTSERLVESMRRVLTEQWVDDNVEAALDAVTSYAVGETDSLAIRVELADRVDIALAEVKLLLRETDAYDLLYDEIVEPIVSDNIGAAIALPFNVEVTQEEVNSALRQVAPSDWVQEQAEIIIDAVGLYVTKKSDSLQITIDIRDNKADARQVLVEVARAKLDKIVAELPNCTAAQIAQIAVTGVQGVPDCMPGGQQASSLVLETFDSLSDQVESKVDTLVLARVPDTLSFTEDDLRATLADAGASDNFDLLEDFRDILGDGWTYTDIDLKADLIDLDGPDAVDLLEDIRSFLADSWTYTEQDLREDVDFTVTSDLGLGESLNPSLDTGRDWLKRARTFRFLVYLPVVMVLLVIAVLGGRTWRGRIGWAAGYLFVSAAIIFSISGPVFGVLADDEIDELHIKALEEIGATEDFRQTKLLLIDKGFELVEAITDTFASGVANKSALIMVLSLIVLGLVIFWQSLRGLIRRDGEPTPALETGHGPPSGDQWTPGEGDEPAGGDDAPPGEDDSPPRDHGDHETTPERPPGAPER